jgi:uncharacterized protein YgiM (DUF1202 family)
MKNKFIIVLLSLLLLTACTRPTKTYVPTILPSAGPTVTVEVKITSTPAAAALPALETATPGVSLSATPFTSFTVYSFAEGMMFRTNPGVLFDAIRMLGKADELTVLGTAPGNEWINVTIADGTEGWVFRQLLTSDVDLTQIKVIQPENADVFTAKVTDVAGNPIQGIGFNISTEGTTVVVVSDKNGDVYWYHPTDLTGSWLMQMTGIACESNVWADDTCANYKAGFTGNIEPVSTSFELPYTGDPLQFIFK